MHDTTAFHPAGASADTAAPLTHAIAPPFDRAHEQAEFEQHMEVLIRYDPDSAALTLARHDSGTYCHPLVQAQWHGWLSARRASAERAARTSSFPAWLASDITPPASVTDYARMAYEAGRASAGELVAEKWAVYYDNLGEQPYTSRFVSDWTLYDSKDEANAFIATLQGASSPARHYSARPVHVLVPAAAASAQPAQPTPASGQPAGPALREEAEPIPTIFMDELDAARAGHAWLQHYLPQGVRLVYSDDTGRAAPPVKWVALFDRYDRLVAAYLLTRDAKNFTQLTLVPGRGWDCEVNPVSSRMCQQGTKSCVTDHAAIAATGPTEPATPETTGAPGGRRKILMPDGRMLDVTPPPAAAGT